MSLRRTRADWPIVAAAWLITLLAAVLLAAGPIYSSAAAQAGLRRTIDEAAATETTIGVSLYGPPAAVAAADAQAQAELLRAVEPLGGTIVRDARSSGGVAFAERPAAAESGAVPILGFLDGLPEHASLVAGAWPVESRDASSPMEVAVLDAVANELHLAAGDELDFAVRHYEPSGPTHDVIVPARLVGVFAIDDVADPYWGGDSQLTTGVPKRGGSRLYGPFLTTPAELLERAGVASVQIRWHVIPNLDRLQVDDAARVRSAIQVLPQRLQALVGEGTTVSTGLPTLLGSAERSLLVSRTAVLLLLIQLAVLAGYAVVLVASMLVEHRRVDTALLVSRGAGPSQVALLAMAEGLLVAVPAALLAPWLAVGATAILNAAGPLAEAGLHIAPQVSRDGYLAAGAAAALCVVLLVLPAVLSARAFAAEQRGISRQETRPFGQRMGIEIALLAVSGIALLQLRLYGAPLTRTVQGSLGLDPLLVAAPAIGLLAGGILALRILPLLAQAAETAISRGRSLVGSLGSRQLARRPLRYTRAALLLMLALSMGVFTLSYAATWASSQRDQASYQAGADVRVMPGGASRGLPAWALRSAYLGLPGVEQASLVERAASGITVGNRSGDILAIDADTAADVTLFRADQAAVPLATLMEALREGRPDGPLVALPAGTTNLRIVPHLEVGSIGRFVFDPETGEGNLLPDPGALADVRLRIGAIVRDGHGLLTAVHSDAVPASGPGAAAVLSLWRPATGLGGVVPDGAQPDGPLELVALSVEVALPIDAYVTHGTVGVDSISASGGPDGPWADISLDSAGDWRAAIAHGIGVFDQVPADHTVGTTVLFSEDSVVGGIYGNGRSQPAARLRLTPASIATAGGALPAVVNRALLEASGSAEGDTLLATIEGGLRRLTIVGVVEAFPTTDPARPTAILDEPTLGLLRLQGSGAVHSPDEWWLSAGEGDGEALAASLGSGPFAGTRVETAVGRAHGLAVDPVALGVIGGLSLGVVATGLVALVGLAVSAAVSARQRRTEFALLRALGLSGSQLSAWLWLENGSLVLVSLIAGTGLGLLVGWLVLPFITVTQQATAPIPSVIVAIPWDQILALEVISGLATVVAVAAIGRIVREHGAADSVLRLGED